MSDLTVSATFTQSGGQPATGLALTDIEIRLVRQHKATGDDEVIWTNQNPTEEIDGVGSYVAIYTEANLSVYNYFGSITYIGAVSLDVDYVNGNVSANSVGAAVGTATAVGIAYPLPRTHLSIYRFARIFGINPVHMAGGTSSILFPVQSCDRPWSRHLWQQPDQESIESILLAIQDAESTIAGHLGYQVSRWWRSGVKADAFKGYSGMFTNGINIGGQRAAIALNDGHVIAGGRRAVTAISEGALVTYTDEDSDGVYETAQIVVPYAETYDWREIKVYFSGKSGDPRWEIRPTRSVTITETELTVVMDSWQLVDPDVQARFPGPDGLASLDYSDVDYFVPTVDIYREYNDETVPSVQLRWEKLPQMNGILAGIGTDEAAYTTQDGVMIVRDNGLVAPIPASYDETAGWTVVDQTVDRSPDRFLLWYYSGFTSEDWESGLDNDPLDNHLAMAIAYLAAARLSRNLCQCGENLIGYLREPNGFSSVAGNFLAVSDTLQNCPFGTRRGEWLAYNMIRSPQVVRRLGVAVG